MIFRAAAHDDDWSYGRAMDIAALSLGSVWAALLVSVLYVPGIRAGINLADEGYLWYGTFSTLRGAIPIRDFRAYDIGRYYWCALWMALLGRGLIALRIALILTQMIALSLGVYTLYLATGQWLGTALASLTLAAWMLPRYKHVDIVFPIAAVLVALLLAGSPVPQNYALAGAFAGMCLLFGLNHALYAAGGIGLLIGLMAFNGHGLGWSEACARYAAGLATGAMPALLAMLLIPGLGGAYWRHKILALIRRGTTNLPLTVPWLWRAAPPQLSYMPGCTRRVVRAVFTLIPIFYGFILLRAVFGQGTIEAGHWPEIAAACIGAFYWHHALSRADITHLAQASPPLIIGLGVTLSGHAHGWVLLSVLAAVSLWCIYRPHEALAKAWSASQKLQRTEFDGNVLWLDEAMAQYLSALHGLVEKYSGAHQPVLLLPKLVTLYPLFSREPAVYDVFCVYPASEAAQGEMIAQLQTSRPSLAIIDNSPVDSCEALRFSNTHPRVWDYLQREYARLDKVPSFSDNHWVFIRIHTLRSAATK